MARDDCHQCFRVKRYCLCSAITPFQIQPLVVLLVHPREFMSTVGTARIVRASIRGSLLLRGTGPEFDRDPVVQRLLDDPTLYPVMLFPGGSSLNLSEASSAQFAEWSPPGRRLAIFVVDGTWTTARQLLRESDRLSPLPRISFNVEVASIYEFKKQPRPECLSTVEATSLLIAHLERLGGCTVQPPGAHLRMLEAFRSLIATQLEHDPDPLRREDAPRIYT